MMLHQDPDLNIQCVPEPAQTHSLADKQRLDDAEARARAAHQTALDKAAVLPREFRGAVVEQCDKILNEFLRDLQEQRRALHL